ncbi:MAG: UDP-N-acetylmuramoyl-L-alanine--D-glutamate ligase [Corynebacteriales bacterium]|nr:UDP-N-acetylmuramoyl-L-alanine--D-glutamate ligase [Mycobacteriales bacterium]
MPSVSEYAGKKILVGGAGISGRAMMHALQDAGAQVIVANKTDVPALGAPVVVDPQTVPEGVDALLVSPGWPPSAPLVRDAISRGITVYSEPELAWRLNAAGPRIPWLAVTGTNGKTTTVTMLASILTAAGLRTAPCGNFGYPVLSAVLDDEPYDVLAVELSSFQLHWSRRLAPRAAVVLNLADDHLDWHGGFAAYAEAKYAMWRGVATGSVAIGNADDERVRQALPMGGVTFTLDEPASGQLGIRDGMLIDYAFSPEPVPLAPADSVRPAGQHHLANALAAAALARAYGVSAEAVAKGLANYVPEPHRNALVAEREGIRWVDDSKATNPHAALASLNSYERVVWVAGGQLKGVDVDELVRAVAPRLSGAVLLGVDRAEISAALSRHAPRLPVLEVASTDDSAMHDVVNAAARLAKPGDTVLLAPAAASLDMFDSYAQRGRAFAHAVAGLS